MCDEVRLVANLQLTTFSKPAFYSLGPVISQCFYHLIIGVCKGCGNYLALRSIGEAACTTSQPATKSTSKEIEVEVLCATY